MKEAANVANFLMMICDNTGVLPDYRIRERSVTK